MSDMTAVPGKTVSITANAAKRVAELIEQEGRDDLKLRIEVSGGGCSGFQYGFKFDEQVNDDDLVIERDGITMLVDEVSLELLAGSEVDYVEELVGSAFKISNPNAQASCGCGTSFSI